jgi:hypothetical protein
VEGRGWRVERGREGRRVEGGGREGRREEGRAIPQ